MRTAKKKVPGAPVRDAAIATPSSQLVSGGTINVISLAICQKKQVYLRQRSQRRCKTVTGPLPGLEEMWKTSPSFILNLDKLSEVELNAVAVLFKKTLSARPPSELRLLQDKRDREEALDDILMHLFCDNRRVLRSYRDIGLPFVFWFVSVTKVKAKEVVRRIRNKYKTHPTEVQNQELDIPDFKPDCLDELIREEQEEILLRAIAEMPIECQVLILASFLSYSGKEIAILRKLPQTDENAKGILNQLSYCRRKLVDNANIIHDASRRRAGQKSGGGKENYDVQ